MLHSHPMFVSENESFVASVESEDSFFVRQLLWGFEFYNDDSLYEQIVFKVFRQPKQLISHIQRIYFTYHHGMKEQLYAALVDFLWVLDGKGKALSSRMVYATRSLLSVQQFDILKKLESIPDNEEGLANKFTLFTRGTIGSSVLVSRTETDEQHYDALEIARGFIEYSQLDEAKKTLEKAIFEMPERHDLQIELLDLYSVTKDFQAYIELNNKLKKSETLLSTEWKNFSDVVADRNHEK